MALVLADRVRETTTVTGTGTATLLGAVSGYQSFSAVGNANTTYYVIANQSATEWEVGIGTYTASGTTLSRDTVLSSSNSGSLVNFSAGTKDVFVDYPAGRAVYENAAGNVDGYPITGGTINNTTIGATTPSTGVFTTLTATGQTSLGGVAGAETVRVNTGTNTGKYTLFEANTANNVQLIGAPNSANLGLYSTGGGLIRFYTASALQEQQFVIGRTASAVNYVQVTGSATGNSPNLGAQGSDSNINMAYSSKGTFGHAFYSNNFGQLQFTVAHAASAVNWFQATGGATGFGPVLSAQGSDTNIPAVLQPKGTGALQAQQTDSTATGGNARGANAVDWQTNRNSASQVASGAYSTIAGGTQNSSISFASFMGGGSTNYSSGTVSFIGGGVGNTTGGYGAIVVGGSANSSLGYFNFIGGGYTNSATTGSTITTQSATMNGTTAVTLSGSNASIKVGQYITGTSISGDTYVSAISGTSLTLSKVASGSSTSTLSFFTPHGVVVGGGNNQATGSYSFIGGGGDAGTAANRNAASGDWSTVVGGRGNQATGVGSFVGGGGNNAGTSTVGNTASGISSFVGAGVGNSASNLYSAVLAGQYNTALGQFGTILSGKYGTDRAINGYTVFSPCNQPISAASGVSQAALLVLGRQTTDATPTVLTNDASSGNTVNQVILPNNSAYYFKGSVIANVTGGGNTKGWTIEGAIKRGANAASTALVGTPTVTSGYADAGASTWAITATADTTNGGLAITFTGQAGTTIRVVCKVETTEVTF